MTTSDEVYHMKVKKTKNCGVQCQLQPTMNMKSEVTGKELTCTELASTDDMIILQYYRNGNLYKGVLLNQRNKPQTFR